MRIQHNIMAMNAYRNYSSNTGALSKNLEKLSSGYKINRAGDDAAGLAISEKMRAQITGLKAAQKNAKDGISLVQTAEGALTEVHDMLNRMVDLADQSANGTYDDTTDRANLQKEITALKAEIDRVADASNFNGQKLLDGSLSSTGSTAASAAPPIKGLTLTETPATAKTTTIATTAITSGLTAGKEISFKFSDSTGKATEIKFTVNAAGDKLIGADGTEHAITGTGEASAAELGTALAAELNKTGLAEQYTITGTATGLSFVSKATGSSAPEMLVMNAPNATVAANANTAAATTGGADAFNTATMASDKVFTIDGKKFMFASTADKAAAADSDVNVVIQAAGTIATGDLAKMASVIEQKTGYKPTVNGTDFQFKANASTTARSGGGLTLQIGEDSSSYNQLTVAVGSMKTSALGISGIDIGTQAGATAAIESIKAAINSVSSTRGDLGAVQNRLEHTINNLSVMTENIQDAEANIRDVDVAEEMMSYTKNNILVQSAQAMLAQANQIPQGVLQLLQ